MNSKGQNLGSLHWKLSYVVGLPYNCFIPFKLSGIWYVYNMSFQMRCIYFHYLSYWVCSWSNGVAEIYPTNCGCFLVRCLLICTILTCFQLQYVLTACETIKKTAHWEVDVEVDFFHVESGANRQVSGLFAGRSLVYSDLDHVVLRILPKYLSDAREETILVSSHIDTVFSTYVFFIYLFSFFCFRQPLLSLFLIWCL